MTQATALTAAKRSHFPLPVTSKGGTLKGEEGAGGGGDRGDAPEGRERGRSGEKERG